MKSQKKVAAKSKKAINETEVPIDYDEVLKPVDQLILSTDELEEMHGNIFYVKEPPKPFTEKIFNHKQRKFVSKADDNNFTIIDMKTSLLHYESVDANTQLENELCRVPEDLAENNKYAADEMQEEEELPDFGTNDVYDNMPAAEDVGEEFLDEGNEINEMDEMNEEESSVIIGPKLEKKSNVVKKEESTLTFKSLPIQKLCTVVKLKNKFNFFERFAQAKKITHKNEYTNTIVPKKLGFSANVAQSDIYDAYEKDFTQKQNEKDKELRGKLAAHKSKKNFRKTDQNVNATNREERNLLKVSVMYEKIISLNETDAIAQDFRYYEDQSDPYRGKGEGTLMQMWTLIYENAKHLFVTDISWSPDYFDMFAVSLGIPQGHLPFTDNVDEGYMCIWSLSNSSYPEYVTQTHCGAICLSFHRDHGNVVAVGLRDGSLAVYNVSLPTTEPQYKTDAVLTNHVACVRQVVWCKDLPPAKLNFYSVSEDGTVCQWILMKKEMVKIVRISLVIDMHPEIILNGIKQTYHAKGTTIIFKPGDPEKYLIGTVEGYVFKCNTEWSCYEQRFQAHQMPIIRIDYNKFDSNIYLTCSEDCLVKLWEDTSVAPLLIFDLKTGLSDLCWSPFSSTVFSVITTTDCRIIFYDLDVSAYEPVCDQAVHPAEEYRLVRVAFDNRVPMVVIGSSKSTIVTFKLSPTLRTTMKPPKKVQVTSEMLEFEKLNNMLEAVRVV